VIGGFQVGPFQTNFQQVSGARVINVGAGVDGQSWQEAVQERFDKLHSQLREDVKHEKKIVRRIAAEKKKLEKAKHPEGILANLHLLEQKRAALRREIKDLRLQVEWINIQIEDEDDEEALILLQ